MWILPIMPHQIKSLLKTLEGFNRRKIVSNVKCKLKILQNNLPSIDKCNKLTDISFMSQQLDNNSFSNLENDAKVRYDSIDAIFRTPK